MNELLKDPAVLGAGCVVLVGFILLIWAFRQLMGGSASTSSAGPADFEFQLPTRPVAPAPAPAPAARPLSVVSPDTNPFANVAPPVRTPPPPAVSRDVMDKVDLISQRLVDMQMLLNKQLSASSAAQGGGGALALTPDMLEKLIQIMGNVVQQVEVLQKSMQGAPGHEEPSATGSSPVPPPGA